MATQNTGIKAIEIYFPSRCIDQTDLEAFLGASTGKHTIGLGQTSMSICDDREDVYSLALTAVASLLKKYTISPSSIGRLEVGTESSLDKAKSCKSVLMQLFPTNPDIEGADTYNACYGGTNALLNAVAWLESSAWDGRDALVVASDIAVYNQPAARPTGGAGCVAMLVGRSAPLVLMPLRASFSAHTYDFYKPDARTEYPIIDGGYSSRCYMRALDGCYRRYVEKGSLRDRGMERDESLPMDRFDFMVFHAPNCKLVAKAYARLLYNDFLADPGHPRFATSAMPAGIREQRYEDSLGDKRLEKHFMDLTRDSFHRRVQPSLTCPTMCGNMYTASVYSGLVSLLSNVSSDELQGRQVGIYSFGSGLVSTLFSFRVVGDVSEMATKLNLHARLAKRRRVSPGVYEEMCRVREQAYQQRDYTPVGRVDTLEPGTYYLSRVDGQFRRDYAMKE